VRGIQTVGALVMAFGMSVAPMSSYQVDMAALKCAGSIMAPVRLEVFSDFQCPHCRILHLETLRKVMAECVATNKVYLVHHDFPLAMHPYAREAARWANAAARVHKYEQASDALFDKQEQWAKDGNIEPVVAAVLSPAELVKVKGFLKDPVTDKAIDSDVALGKQQNVTGTPTMFLQRHQNRYPITTAVSYPILRRFIDEQISR
jgi:protein-disulfide isomerase